MNATTSAVSAGELLHRIAGDVKTIARDEAELAGHELAHSAKQAAGDAVGAVLGGVVALIGLGLLCIAAVAALAPVIGSLAVRLLVMAIVYLGVGGAFAGAFAARLRRDAVPDLSLAIGEARQTVHDARHGLGR